MSEHATSILGTVRGRTYYLTIRVTPSFNDINAFSVTVHYSDPAAEEEIQIARIDTEHGYTHFDRLYRRDQPKDPIDVDVWEAATLLEENWRQYAESFDNHTQD